MEGYCLILNIDPHPTIGMEVAVYICTGPIEMPGQVIGKLTSGNALDFGITKDDGLYNLIHEVEAYTPAVILAYFNKKKKYKSLEDVREDALLGGQFRIYTDSRIHRILDNALSLGLIPAVGLKRNDLVASRRVKPVRLTEKPVMYFRKTPEGIHYQLALTHHGKRFTLPQGAFIPLSNAKGWVIAGDLLVESVHLPALNLKPFSDKDTVFIPEKLVNQYIKNFILKSADRAEIEAEGFDFVVSNAVTAAQISVVEQIFDNTFLLKVVFFYDEIPFQYGEARMTRQKLVESTSGDYSIHRYERAPIEEGLFIDKLTSTGIEETSGGRFGFPALVDGSDLGKVAAWMIDHKAAFEALGYSVEDIRTPVGTLIMARAELVEKISEVDNDWFDIHSEVVIENHRIPFAALQTDVQAWNAFFDLKDGRCFLIPEVCFTDYKYWFEFGKVVDGALRIGRAHGHPRVNKTDSPLASEVPDAILSITEIAAPEGLKAVLRPYQRVGFSWLANHYHNGLGACLADDMGLGKTLQTIALLLHIRNDLAPVQNRVAPAGQMDLFAPIVPILTERPPLNALVVAPSTLLYNWASEIALFAPDLKVVMHSGNQRTQKIADLQSYDVVVTSYNLLVRDLDLLSQMPYRGIILDESQYIKNKESKTYKSVAALSSPFRMTLTGTPIENSLSDLWSQMQFINPGILGDPGKFKRKFQTPIEKQKDETKQQELRSLVTPFLLRRMKSDVLQDLPELTEQVVWCEMEEAQAEIYEQEKAKIRQILMTSRQEGNSLVGPLVLNALMRLRQIAIAPAILTDYEGISSGKVETICEEMETMGKAGHRTLVFSAFLKHIKIYKTWLDANGWTYATLTGEDSAQEKQRAEQALKDGEIQFLLLTMKAGNIGLNLVNADHVILADPWWNPAVEAQAIGRAHRIGQKNPVHALRFITRNTVEEKIRRLQERKLSWSKGIFDDDKMISALTESEIEELIS
jgi:superfamily II DNA or RNA helicase